MLKGKIPETWGCAGQVGRGLLWEPGRTWAGSPCLPVGVDKMAFCHPSAATALSSLLRRIEGGEGWDPCKGGTHAKGRKWAEDGVHHPVPFYKGGV